jgi:hypothetical protein
LFLIKVMKTIIIIFLILDIFPGTYVRGFLKKIKKYCIFFPNKWTFRYDSLYFAAVKKMVYLYYLDDGFGYYYFGFQFWIL